LAPHELAGKPAPHSLLVNVPWLVSAYYTHRPDAGAPQHEWLRNIGSPGSALKNSFNEGHILATTQAICDHRKANRIKGPLFLGMDTHALSEASFASALEVLAANEVETLFKKNFGYTPTPRDLPCDFDLEPRTR